MAYNAPSSRSTGDLINATIWNADIVANIIAVYAGGLSITSQAVGDILYASSTTQFARVAAVATGQVLVSAGTGTAPAWSATPVFTSVGVGTTSPSVPLEASGSLSSGGTEEVFRISGNTGGTQNATLRATATYAASAGARYFGLDSIDEQDQAAPLVLNAIGGGNVGINVVAPAYKFDIDVGTSQVQIRTTNNNALQITENDADAIGGVVSFKKSRGSYASPGDVVNGDDIGGINTLAYSGTQYWGTAKIDFAINGTFTSNTRPPSRIEFSTNAANAAVTERMRITAAGNVGIGTSSPGKPLTVDAGTGSSIAEFIADTTDAAVIKLTNENSTTQTWGFGVAGTGHAVADNAYYIRDETGGSNDFVINTAHNVGIGEPAPVHKLSLRPTPFIHLGYNGTSAATEMGGIKANSYDVENAGYSAAEVDFITGTVGYYGAIQFRTNSDNSTTSRAAVRMTIDQSGDVGIGTTTPNYLSSVNALTVQGSTQPRIELVGTRTSNDAIGDFTFINRVSTTNNVLGYIRANRVDADNSGSLAFYTYNAGSAVLALSLTPAGALSKSSGSFKIDHPLPALNETHSLVHSFVEGPRADLIYRGSATLVDGAATVDLDDAAGMTTGTWALLCRDEQVYTSNETGWKHVRGSVSGSTLTIDCEESDCTDTVSWMVVAERQDQHMIDTDWTDDDGRPIVEPLR